MRMRLSILIALMILAASPSWAQVWPNEPAGAGLIVDCPFNSKPTPTHDPAGCGIGNFYNAGSIVQDATAPLSPSNVFKSAIQAGQSTGGSQLNYLTPQVYREMYVGMKWRINSQFFGRQVANKMFFVRGPQSNGFFGLMGGPGGGNAAGSPFFLFFGPNVTNQVGQPGALDNSHTCGGSGFTCFPNVGSGQTVPAGNWFTIEAYLKSSTTSTSRDGIVRWWVNGQPAGNYTNMNLSVAGLNEWVWSETWDGTVNPPPSTEWAHYIDHLRVSIPNCPAGGCPFSGGGTTPPPPPPPPVILPPLGVSGLGFGS